MSFILTSLLQGAIILYNTSIIDVTASSRGILRGKVGAVEAEDTAEVSRLLGTVVDTPLVTTGSRGSRGVGVPRLRGVGSFRRGSALLPRDRPVSPPMATGVMAWRKMHGPGVNDGDISFHHQPRLSHTFPYHLFHGLLVS